MASAFKELVAKQLEEVPVEQLLRVLEQRRGGVSAEERVARAVFGGAPGRPEPGRCHTASRTAGTEARTLDILQDLRAMALEQLEALTSSLQEKPRN